MVYTESSIHEEKDRMSSLCMVGKSLSLKKTCVVAVLWALEKENTEELWAARSQSKKLHTKGKQVTSSDIVTETAACYSKGHEKVSTDVF